MKLDELSRNSIAECLEKSDGEISPQAVNNIDVSIDSQDQDDSERGCIRSMLKYIKRIRDDRDQRALENLESMG